MDQMKNTSDMLELLPYPAFTVAEGKLLQVNQAARLRQLAPGRDITELLVTGSREYEAFSGGCLCLTLEICGSRCGASVKQLEGCHLFLLDQDAQQAALQAYGLAARELRKPLNALAAASEGLESPGIARSVHQLLRLADNMSDACRYDSQAAPQLATLDLTALFGQILEKAGTLAAQAGRALRYTGPGEPIYGMADEARLERAVYNLLANAIKFSPAGEAVRCSLKRSGNLLYFTVEDRGQGITGSQMGNVFARYLRQPDLEDSRQGIGLGMLLVRAAAATHGGTVLLEQPETGGSRVTMTLTLRQNTQDTLRTPVVTVDSGWDRGLVELSEVLPLSAYENI